MNDIIRTKTLRAFIGWLGILLPWIVVLLQLFNDTFVWPQSISATWYTNACTPFMMILGSAGILLMCYHGYNIADDVINTLAGIFGWCICLFPCNVYTPGSMIRVGTFMIPASISNILHSVAAVLFFAILAYNSWFQFTKGSDNPTPNKKKRNIIFRVCAVGMLVSFAILLIPKSMFRCKVWFMEFIALSCFGISWLTKANKYKVLFKD